MVDLFKDIDWDPLLEKEEDDDLDYGTFIRFIRREAHEFVTTQEFKDHDIRKPVLDNTFSNFVLVSGLPQFPKDKESKFKNVLSKFLQKKKIFAKLVSLELEIDEETSMSTGNASLEYISAESAQAAERKLNGTPFTKTANLNACTFDNFNDLMRLGEKVEIPEYVSPQEQFSHLQDSLLRNQIASLVKKGASETNSNLEFFWHNDVEGYFDEIKTLREVKASDIQFSQSGAYLAALHSQGFVIYGGADFRKVRTITHRGCKAIKFSRNDTYAVTFNGPSTMETGNENLIVWDLLKGTKIRSFRCSTNISFEQFSWSFDEKYAATIIENSDVGANFMCVFDATTMTFAKNEEEKRQPIQVQSPQQFKWANFKNQLIFICYSFKPDENVSQAGVFDADNKKLFSWIDISYKIHKVQIAWEQRDSFITMVLDATLKYPETVLQIGNVNQKTQQIDVVVKTLTPENVQHEVHNVSIDKLGRNVAFFISKKVPTDKGQMKKVAFCEYHKIRFNKKTSSFEIKKTMEVEATEYRDIEWSSIEDVFVFKCTGNIAFGKFKGFQPKKSKSSALGGKGKNKKGKKKGDTKTKEEKNTGILSEMAVSNTMTVNFDSTGRYAMVYEPPIQKLQIFNAFGFRSIVKRMKSCEKVVWRHLPRLTISEQQEKEILGQTQNMSLLLNKYKDNDDERKTKYEHEQDNLKSNRQKIFFDRIKQMRVVWNETFDDRVALKGDNPDNLSDPIEVTYEDKKEEYDRKAGK